MRTRAFAGVMALGLLSGGAAASCGTDFSAATDGGVDATKGGSGSMSGSGTTTGSGSVSPPPHGGCSNSDECEAGALCCAEIRGHDASTTACAVGTACPLLDGAAAAFEICYSGYGPPIQSCRDSQCGTWDCLGTYLYACVQPFTGCTEVVDAGSGTSGGTGSGTSSAPGSGHPESRLDAACQDQRECLDAGLVCCTSSPQVDGGTCLTPVTGSTGQCPPPDVRRCVGPNDCAWMNGEVCCLLDGTSSGTCQLASDCQVAATNGHHSVVARCDNVGPACKMPGTGAMGYGPCVAMKDCPGQTTSIWSVCSQLSSATSCQSACGTSCTGGLCCQLDGGPNTMCNELADPCGTSNAAPH
jgi:hypothetical protein